MNQLKITVTRFLLQNHLKDRNASEDIIDLEVSRYRERKRNTTEEDQEIQEAIKLSRERSSQNHSESSRRYNDDQGDNMQGDQSDSDISEAPVPTRGRGSTRSRGGTRGAGRARGRGGGGDGRGRGRGRGRGKAAEPKNNMSIRDAFASGSQSQRSDRNKSKTSYR